MRRDYVARLLGVVVFIFIHCLFTQTPVYKNNFAQSPRVLRGSTVLLCNVKHEDIDHR